jgi:hypothetical protein
MKSPPSSSRSSRAALLAALALVSAACAGPTAQPVEPSATLDGVPRCDEAPVVDTVEAVVPVRLLVGDGVSSDDARAVVADAQAFFAPFGLGFELEGIAEVAERSVIGGSAVVVSSRLEAAGVAADSPAGRELAMRTALEPMRSFLLRHAVPAKPRVDVVVLVGVQAVDSIGRGLIGEIAGIGLHPGAVPEPLRDSLPATFTPTVFVATGRSAALVAHELGHALGLTHGGVAGNLMHPGSVECLPSLDEAQLAVIAAALS